MLGALRRSLPPAFRPLTSAPRPPMDLREVVSCLEAVAPPSLAEDWDNVGLLVAPPGPLTVGAALLAVDVTEAVLREARELPAQLLVSYHPPIFRPLRRVTPADWKGRVLAGALENRIAIYSPHTALDAVPGGVNDWLAEGLGECSTRPLTQSVCDSFPSEGSHRLEVLLPEGFDSESLLARLRGLEGVRLPTETPRPGHRLSFTCAQSGLVGAVRLLGSCAELAHTLEISRLEKAPLPDTGMGRFCRLRAATSIGALVQRVKQHLGVTHLRLALGVGHSLHTPVSTVAVCAGSGGSVLEGVEAELYLTGEMSHHQTLDAVSRGRTVLLAEHSTSERGFLPRLASLLAPSLSGRVTLHVSSQDREPLAVV